MKKKGSILEVTISLTLFFIIILDFIIVFNFNFNILRIVRNSYEEKIIENNLINVLKRDIYFNKEINNYKLKKIGNKYFVETSDNSYYLGVFKYIELKEVKLKEKTILLDNTEIGKFKYLSYLLNDKKMKIILENIEWKRKAFF